MGGLQDVLPKHLLCGWQEVGVHHYKEGTYDPICEWCDRKLLRYHIYVLEHDDYQRQIKVGSNCKEEAIAKCIGSDSHTDNSDDRTESGGEKGTSNENPSDEKPLPVPELILLAGASMILMGNLGLFEDFYSQLIPNRSPPTQRQTPSENPRNPNNRNRYRRRLSPEVEKIIRDCLKENVKNLIGVPELEDLVGSLMSDDEYSISETQRQVRLLYKQVQQLYKTISDCDPSLIQELLAADQADEQEEFQDQLQNQSHCGTTVRVVGEMVNVRASPSLEGEVIGQVLYGTCLQIDIEILAFFSAQERSAAITGIGWYPIILPDGKRGYIHSQYVRT